MKADILRQKFLDFFKSKKHRVVESDSLVPQDDPTVLFTPAGMNQFKKEFLGYNRGFKRAATAQRCLRTDDLDKVGRTCGHHTFFEMLGNFSFGDYFKEEAIAWAWEFLTVELKIKKERLWVSVHQEDDEVDKIWQARIRVPANKIIKLTDKENFWPSEARQKGPNGPCGPCSEIFYDWGSSVGCRRKDCNPACDCGRFVEVWNLVFTQFNRKEGGRLESLPNKSIDTGMGLERLTAVMQGVRSNFETDLFQPLIKEITDCRLSTTDYRLIYAVADHIRAITFAIYDGVLPSNEGRGYVVRKLIRKSILHLRELGIKGEFLYRLVPLLAEIMHEPYPDLRERREDISGVILAEEKNFISTLDTSEMLFKEKFSGILNKPDPDLTGVITFQLYDTYGVPLQLTQAWLERHNLSFSQGAFERELEKQKIRSKLTSSMKGDVFGDKDLDLDVKKTKFLGYKDYETSAKIMKIIKDNTEVKEGVCEEEIKIILDKTVFYAESGGQVGDTGEILKGKNIFTVLDTKKSGEAIVHIGKVKSGSFKKADTVLAKVDIERRLSIARNHTATHLLQAALRKVLGSHVKQQGSLVAPDKLRFDFTHFKDLSRGELTRIEELVNNYILDNHSLQAKQVLLQEAKKQGALAFFAEKYGERVRLVSIGDISKELCGGTHLKTSGQIGVFRIIQESSVARGMRRIEAVTGACAYKIIKEEQMLLKDISAILDVPENKLVETIEAKCLKIKALEKQVSVQRLDGVKSVVETILANAEEINNIKLITEVIDNADMDLLRKTLDLIKQKTTNSIIALGARQEKKALLVLGLTPDLTQRFDAARLIRDIAGFIGGSGGGRGDFAQSGGDQPDKFSEAFERLKNIISVRSAPSTS